MSQFNTPWKKSTDDREAAADSAQPGKLSGPLGRMRAMRVSMLAVLGLVVLFHYQNCAPAGGSSGAASAAGEPVTIIDQNDQGFDVSFTQTQVVIQSSVQTVSLNGACSTEQDGAVFQWQLKAADSSLLGSGTAKCVSGAFQVQITPTQSLNCDQSYEVSAQIGNGQAGEVLLTRNCAAAGAVAVTAEQKSLVSDSLRAMVNEAAPSGSSCLVERRDGQGSGCSLVCYSSAGVERQRESLPASSCESSRSF